jgi:protein involved in polysaccharide export with SLBB domain
MLQVSGDKDVITGTYVIGADGRVAITPDLVLQAGGRDRQTFEAELRRRLVDGGYVRDVASNVRILEVASEGVMVSVEGAVFEPGVLMVGDRVAEQKATVVDHPAQGDYNMGRTLTHAIEMAGGLRPDAWPDTLYVVRGNNYAVLDVRSALVGGVGQAELPTNMQLAKGDRIIVPSTGCFDAHLVRPSPVTAPGIRVYMSNLSRPASDNASSAINHDSTSLPYGTRFLQGLVSANCVGGSAMNAQRSAVLISRNPISGHSVVISRSIEHLVRNAERDDIDPYLMPGDAIACYDSGAMTVVDAASVLGNLLGPAVLIKGLKP